MASLREKAESEFANIEKTLAALPPAEQLPELSVLELAGVAALLHSFYNGIVIWSILLRRRALFPRQPQTSCLAI
jgi:hypothetical protein